MAEEDDDFGEFGGFEAADPDIPGEEQPDVEASPPPWALFPAGNAAPDLIQAQGTIFPQLEPPFPPDEVPVHPGRGTNSDVLGHEDSPGFDLGNDVMAAQAGVSHNDILASSHGSGSSSSSRNSGACSQPPFPQQPPDIQSLDITASSRPKVAFDVDPDIPPLELPAVEESGAGNEVPDVEVNHVVLAEAGDAQAGHVVGPEKLSLVEQEKERIQQDLSELLSRHHELVEEFDTTQRQLAEERERYQTLQTKHEKDLNDIRQAGHDTLAVIVEEYKSLCRTSVLEQQEAMEIQMKECLAAERERFEEAMSSQRDRLMQALEEEGEKHKEDMKKMREELAAQHQSELQVFMEKEQERQREMLSTAIRVEQEECERLLKAAIEEERKETKLQIDQERENAKVLLEVESTKSAELVQEAVKEEQRIGREEMAKAVEEERARSRQLTNEVLEKAREEMQAHIKEQKQSDSTVRHRQLAALDLFLEGARHQLQDLMTKPAEDNG